MTPSDEIFMSIALSEAKKAFEKNEVPIGCVIVKEGKIVAKAHNLVEKKQNATCHAEMLCIEKATIKIGNFRLLDCVLYTTLEPCVMCAGAILLSRVKKVVFAAKDIRHGAILSQYQLFSKPHPIHNPEFVQGPFEKESSDLLKLFFQKQRKKNVL